MTLSFWPVPDVGTVDIVLYTQAHLAEFTSKTTGISFPPGMARLLEVTLAIRAAPRYGSSAVVSPDLRQEQQALMGDFKRMASRTLLMTPRPEFREHSRYSGRRYDLYTDR